jgi:hypothetical protein
LSKSAQHGDIDTSTLAAGQLALSPGCTYDFPGALKKLVNLASSAIAGSDGSARGSQVDLTEGSSDDEAYAFLDWPWCKGSCKHNAKTMGRAQFRSHGFCSHAVKCAP